MFIAAAVVSGFLFAVVEFWAVSQTEGQTGDEQSLQLAQKALRHRRGLAASAQAVQGQTTTLEARLAEEEQRLLAAADVNQAGAQLQEWLVQRATEQQLNVVRSDFLPPSSLAETYVRVPVRIELNGRITQLAQFLTTILQGERFAALDELQISGSGGDKEKRARCVVVISCLMKKTD